MPKGKNQKLKLIYLIKILQNKTDDTKGITINEIISLLAEYDIEGTRKGLYDDFQALDRYGLEVKRYKEGKYHYYYLVDRQFEIPELKLLVDAVQSSKFITVKKSKALIDKLEDFASENQRKQLNRQVFVSERIKAMNESIYYGVDEIYEAISNNKKIRFQYGQWDLSKKLVPRHDGDFYIVSPWAMTFDNENYYMIAYDQKDEVIKHFRVDKMLRTRICEEARDGKELFKSFNLSEYVKKTFGMYNGEEIVVRLHCKNEMIGVLLDRFGTDIPIIAKEEGYFETQVKVALSKQFLAWIIAIGEDVKIIGPDKVINEMKEMLKNLDDIYVNERK